MSDLDSSSEEAIKDIYEQAKYEMERSTKNNRYKETILKTFSLKSKQGTK